MKRSERLRRVALLCCHCLRNVALYRSAWRRRELIVRRQFWVNANGNAIDIAVLEWCKLFADRKGKHHWTRVVSDEAAFLAQLLRALGMSAKEFHDFARSVLRYRNKFVAHLDDERTMHIPATRVLRRSAAFLYDWLRADAIDSQYLQDAPSCAREHYSAFYSHGRAEHLRNAA